MPTPSKEFHDPTAEANEYEWEQAGAYSDGVSEMILHEEPDGSHTRFLKLEPGTESESVITHEFYEEAYVLHGELIDKRLDESFTAGMYAYRKPGMEHGPYRSPNGCLTFEVRYYE
ncbi:cupin domain-containing protein [Halorarum halobium]|uniref:cupin domain-containing protein n=1 Tax=Halorarum halobium TaxID=3075121 RepID=UPI0028A69628|nr:cupin domain-containing protein [Halobaculum sp. XH14]